MVSCVVAKQAMTSPRSVLTSVVVAGGLLGLAAISLVYPASTRMYSWPWSAIYSATLLVPVLLLVLRAREGASAAGLPPPAWSFTVLGGAGAILTSALVSPDPGVALRGAAPLLSAIALYLFIYLWIQDDTADSTHRRERLLTGAGLLLAAILAVGLVTFLSHLPGRSAADLLAGRNPYPLGHSNYTAGIALLMLPCFAALGHHGSVARRLAWHVVLLGALAFLFTSGSRGGLLGLAVLVLVQLPTVARRLGRSPWLLLGGAIVLLGALLWLNPRTRAALSGGSLRASDVQRSAMLNAAVQMGRDRPLLGWGPGTTPLIYPRYRARLEGGVDNVLELHSLPADLWAELGGAGLLAAAAVGVLALAAAARDPVARGIVYSLSGYAVFSLTDWQLDLPVFSALIAAALAAATPPPRARRSDATALGAAPADPLPATVDPFNIAAANDIRQPRSSRAVFALAALAAGVALLIAWGGRPDPTPPLNVRALALASEPAHAPEAIALLRQSLALNPAQEIAHFNLGWLLVLDAPAEAEIHFAAAAHLVPDKGGVYFGLGLARLNQGHDDAAADAFALECVNDPIFLVSPWRATPRIQNLDTAIRAKFFSALVRLRAGLPAGSTAAAQALYLEQLATWIVGGPAVVASDTPERRRFFAAVPPPEPAPLARATVLAYRRERPGYPVLMRNLDLAIPTDVFLVQENALASGAWRFLFPAKGWAPSPALLALLDHPDSAHK